MTLEVALLLQKINHGPICFSWPLTINCIHYSFFCTLFVVPVQAPTERFTTTQQEDEEIARRFDLQFVCIREKELARQQRLEKFGAIAVYDADMAKMAATYGEMGEDGRAYLATLTPPSD